MSHRLAVLFGLVATVVPSILGPVSAAPQQKRALTHEDYDRWPSIRSRAWSPDGKWLAYSVNPAWGDGVLYIREVDGTRKFSHARGSSPSFSADGRYVVFSERESQVEAREKKMRALRGEKVAGAKAPSGGAPSGSSSAAASMAARRAAIMSRMRGRRGGFAGMSRSGRGKLIVLDLVSGKKRTTEKTQGFRLLDEGAVLAMHMSAPERSSSARPSGSRAAASRGGAGAGERMRSSREGRRGRGRRGAAGAPARGARGMRSARGVAAASPASRTRGGTDLVLQTMSSGALRRFSGITSYQSVADDAWLLLTVTNAAVPMRAGARDARRSRGARNGAEMPEKAGKAGNAGNKVAGAGKGAAQGAGAAEGAQGVAPKTKASPKPWWQSIEAETLSDGLHALRLKDGRVFPLLEGKAKFRAFTTDREHEWLAFASDFVEARAAAEKAAAAKAAAKKAAADAKKAGNEKGAVTKSATAASAKPEKSPRYDVWFWDFTARAPRRVITHDTPGIPAEHTISSGGLSFSKDASVLSFSVSGPSPKPAPKILDEEKVVVDIWHYRDGLIQPQQARSRGRTSRSRSCVWHIADERCVVLGDEKMPSVSLLTSDGSRGFATDSKPYERLVSHDGRYADYYIVNTLNGKRRKVLEKSRTRPSPSPSGRYIMHFGADAQWHLHDIARGTSRCLTEGLDVAWANELEDRPQPARAYGVAGWTEGELAVLVYDRYDIWSFEVQSGEHRCLTDGFGRANRIVLRSSSFDYRGDRDKLSAEQKE